VSTTTIDGVDRIGVKFYAENPAEVRPERFIGLFHTWIQRHTVPGLLIDVADYAHVPEGPGVMIIGHEADYAIDLAEGRPGVLYQRKRDGEGSFEDRLRFALETAHKAASEIEADASVGVLRFDRDEVVVRVLDRRRLPNDDASVVAIGPALARAVSTVFPAKQVASAERTGVDGDPLTLRVVLADA
jgi:hypothetical protein